MCKSNVSLHPVLPLCCKTILTMVFPKLIRINRGTLWLIYTKTKFISFFLHTRFCQEENPCVKISDGVVIYLDLKGSDLTLLIKISFGSYMHFKLLKYAFWKKKSQVINENDLIHSCIGP